jgi:hypothetical protein
MQYSDYKCFRFGFDSGIAFVSIDQARVREALKVGAETFEGELEMDFLSKLSPI